MKLYIEANVCDWCLAYEALQWIALGRVPEFHYSDPLGEPNEQPVDYRVDPNVVLDNGPDCDLTFSEAEFLAVGNKIDYSRYQDGIYSTPHHGSWGYLETSEHAYRMEQTIKKLEASEDSDHRLAAQEFRTQQQQNQNNFEWAMKQEEAFETIMDRAKAKLFDSLADGKVTAKGWVFPSDEEDVEYEDESVKFLPISSNLWTFKGADWDENRLDTDAQNFHFVVIDMAELLSVFPNPIGIVNQKTGTRFMSSIALEHEETAPQTRTGSKSRGRPPLGGIAFKNAVKHEFRRRQNAGELPAKTEAVLAEIREFSEKIIGTPVSRTKAQRIFSTLNE